MSYFIEHEYTAQGHIIECLFNMHRDLSERDEVVYSDCIPVAVFSAFAIEAYINGVGAKVVNFWDSVERNSWQSKVEILHAIAEKTPDWGADPLSFAKEMFKLRDRLAHGKSEIFSMGPYPTRTDAGDHYHEVRKEPEWMLKLNKKWLARSKRMFVETMDYFRDLHGLPDNDHLLLERTEVVERNG